MTFKHEKMFNLIKEMQMKTVMRHYFYLSDWQKCKILSTYFIGNTKGKHIYSSLTSEWEFGII